MEATLQIIHTGSLLKTIDQQHDHTVVLRPIQVPYTKVYL